MVSNIDSDANQFRKFKLTPSFHICTYGFFHCSRSIFILLYFPDSQKAKAITKCSKKTVDNTCFVKVAFGVFIGE